MVHERLDARAASCTARHPSRPSLAAPPSTRRPRCTSLDRVGVALGDLLTIHPRPTPATSVLPSRCSGGSSSQGPAALQQDHRLDDAFGKEDRFTQAVTLFALLELYRRGEATWTQKETFGRIEVHSQ